MGRISRWTIGAGMPFLLASILFASALGQKSRHRKPTDAEVPPQLARLSKYTCDLLKSRTVAGGVLLVAHQGKICHLEAFGMSDREQGIEISPTTIFRIASMTKPITSCAIMILYEQGRLDLDAPVKRYLPEFTNPRVVVGNEPTQTVLAKNAITIRHLLTHTSGLGYNNSPVIGSLYAEAGIQSGVCFSRRTLADNIAKLSRIPLLFEPGTQWHYGMSTDVLGLVVERVSDAPLNAYVEDEICRPLGMEDTSFSVPAEKRSRLAATYVRTCKGIRELRDSETHHNELFLVPMSRNYPYAKSHRYLSGGGGLCSTAPDYLRFCQMILNGGQIDGIRLLREDTVTMMTSNQVGNLKCGQIAETDYKFGLGFAVFPDDDTVPREMRGDILWGGIWGTVFRISPSGDWIGILLTQRANDKVWRPGTLDFTKLVGELD